VGKIGVLEVEGDDNVLEYVTTEVSGNTPATQKHEELFDQRAGEVQDLVPISKVFRQRRGTRRHQGNEQRQV
jgi:hypothetical protein